MSVLSIKDYKARTWWIFCFLFLYFFYYLSYDSTLINNDIILIATSIVLIVEMALRIIERKIVSLDLIIAIGASIWAFACSFLNGSGFGSAINQTTLLISLSLFSSTKLTTIQRKRLVLCIVVILLTILVIFSATTQYHAYYISILPYFSSSTQINPNCIAMLTFYLYVFSFEYLEITNIKTRNKRVLQMAILCGVIYYIYISSARTSMSAAIVFTILFTFCKYRKALRTREIFLFALCFSLFIVFVYCGLYSVGFLKDEVIWGKGFYSGREDVWNHALLLFSESPIIGFSNKIAFGSGEFLSAHNSLLAIMCYFGILGLISTIFVLYLAFKKIDYKDNTLIVSAIFSTIIIMCFETCITDWSLLLPFCLLFAQTKKKGALYK